MSACTKGDHAWIVVRGDEPPVREVIVTASGPVSTSVVFIGHSYGSRLATGEVYRTRIEALRAAVALAERRLNHATQVHRRAFDERAAVTELLAQAEREEVRP